MMQRFKTILLAVLCMLPWMGSHAQSMYGDAVKADVKMKYVYSLDEALKKAKKEKKPIFCNCFAHFLQLLRGLGDALPRDEQKSVQQPGICRLDGQTFCQPLYGHVDRRGGRICFHL